MLRNLKKFSSLALTLAAVRAVTTTNLGASDTSAAGCEIISGQVTVLDCRQQYAYEIYLTNSLTTTKLQDIENIVKEEDDAVAEAAESEITEVDEVRHILVTTGIDSGVVYVSLSHEHASDYKDSVIVAVKDDDEEAGANQIAVHRYYQNATTGWLESAHLFSFENTEAELTSLTLFDGFAMGYFADYSMMHMDTTKVAPGEKLLSSYVRESGDFTDTPIQKYVWVQDAQNFDMFAVVEAIGGTYLEKWALRERVGLLHPVLTKDQNSATPAFIKGTELTALEATDNLLVVGCKTCNSGKGFVKFYDWDLTNKHTVDGTSTNRGLGKQISIVDDQGGAKIVWFSSSYRQNGANTLYFNRVVVFYNQDWGVEFQDTLKVVSSAANANANFDLEFATYGQDFFFKSGNQDEIQTFKSCKFNEEFKTDDEQLDSTSCGPCPAAQPFSTWSPNTQYCSSCQSVEGMVQSVAHLKYFHTEACPAAVIEEEPTLDEVVSAENDNVPEPVVDEPEPTAEETEVVTVTPSPEPFVPEVAILVVDPADQGSSSGLIIGIIVGAVVLLMLIVVIYLLVYRKKPSANKKAEGATEPPPSKKRNTTAAERAQIEKDLEAPSLSDTKSRNIMEMSTAKKPLQGNDSGVDIGLSEASIRLEVPDLMAQKDSDNKI